MCNTQNISFRNLGNTTIPTTTHSVFGIYRYPAKFIPQVISYIFTNYSKPRQTVLDPFAGCGTVGLVGRIHEQNYELWDLNPMLETLHNIATSKPPKPLDLDKLIHHITTHQGTFIPKWSNLSYWFPQETIEFLSKSWGFYHSLDNTPLKTLLTIPLLKTTRTFSYNDPQRQKLSKSPKSQKRIQSLLQQNWKELFFSKFKKEIEVLYQKLNTYQDLQPKDIEATVLGGVDAIELSKNCDKEWDLLITSPPYLQAQEYMRNAKLDLFWLGYSEDTIKQLGKKEIPYRDVSPLPIHSKTYLHYLNKIEEPHMRKVFERYFQGVLGQVLTPLSIRIHSHLFLFVGPAKIRNIPIPIDTIFSEHLTSLGWTHELTLIDTIESRVMFNSPTNPATGLEDNRMRTEHLVILRK